jgi:glyoxylase-like metal-dependent hydrolase (beta-lactamase superfamily II)
MRFDARFFVTEVPAGWEPDPDPAEVAECRWVTPSEALAEVGSGHTLMAPPTVEMLQRLDGHERARDAIVALRAEGVGSSSSIYSTRLSPLVRVVLAPNPSFMTGPGTNTYVVGADPTVVIDPAVDDERFVDAVLEAAGSVIAVLVTHRHSDHVGGVATISRRTGAVVRAFGTADAGGVGVSSLADGDVVECGNARLIAVHTPGHASDHICFLLEGAASLFSGDTVLGEGTAVIAPPDGDMRAYLQSLERLRALDIDRIFPGHWRPLDGGRRVIENYIAHRAERERAIVAALGVRGATIEDIVAAVYTDTPTAFHPIAAYSATAHLQMLAADGRVKCVNDRWVVMDVE